jgi:hypothetical protein
MEEPLDTGTAALARELWPELWSRVGALGPEISRPPYPVDDRYTVEGLRHLTRLVVVALQWCVEFGDPDFPAFYRHDDDVTKWGGPNVENTYLRARVRGDAAYVVRGTTGNCHGFVVSTHEGDMQLEQYGVYAELWHDELRTEPDGSFTLHIGGAPRAHNWMPLDPRTTNVTIRQYFDDWDRHVPESFDIARTGAEGEAPRPLTAGELRTRLDDAIAWIERSVRYWNRYIDAQRARVGPNAIAGAGAVSGGSRGIAYGSGFADLADDEAMIVEGVVPDAWSWGFLLYDLGWFQSLDIANRVTSLNGRQLHVDPDGRFRIVVAHHDPGVQNWLDASGLRQVLLTYRYIRTATSPMPTVRVVPLARVRDELPPSTPSFGPADRAAQVERRRVHLARRFRN